PLLRSADGADEPPRAVEQRRDLVMEIPAVDFVVENAAGEQQRHACGARRAQGEMEAFLRADPPERDGISAPPVRWVERVEVDAVLDVAHEVGARRTAL